MPMLTNVLLRTQGKNQLLVAATDLDVSLTAELESHHASDGGIAILASDRGSRIAPSSIVQGREPPGNEPSARQLDGLAVRCRARRGVPLGLAAGQLVGADQALGGDQA